jgi:hypothetical protein
MFRATTSGAVEGFAVPPDPGAVVDDEDAPLGDPLDPHAATRSALDATSAMTSPRLPFW